MHNSHMGNSGTCLSSNRGCSDERQRQRQGKCSNVDKSYEEVTT